MRTTSGFATWLEYDMVVADFKKFSDQAIRRPDCINEISAATWTDLPSIARFCQSAFISSSSFPKLETLETFIGESVCVERRSVNSIEVSRVHSPMQGLGLLLESNQHRFLGKAQAIARAYIDFDKRL